MKFALFFSPFEDGRQGQAMFGVRCERCQQFMQFQYANDLDRWVGEHKCWSVAFPLGVVVRK